MKIKIITRDGFTVCGYAVKTTLEQNDADIARLYADFSESDKDRILQDLPGCQIGYYGLEWYTGAHKSYYYLLGRQVGPISEIPENAMLKTVPSAQYAVAGIPAGTNLMDAWTEFFYTAIPSLGYAPDETHGIYFEYYPKDVKDACELWTPVIPKNK